MGLYCGSGFGRAPLCSGCSYEVPRAVSSNGSSSEAAQLASMQLLGACKLRRMALSSWLRAEAPKAAC